MSYFLPANKPLTWLFNSIATPTAIINPVPPNAREESLPNTPLKVRITGKLAINARDIAPIHEILLTTFLMYLSVSFPGLIPGI